MTLSRRGFLAGSAALAVGAGRTGIALAADGAARHTLVLVHLDGGLDGLSALVPAGERAYYDSRRWIAVPSDRVLPLDTRFGLHPALGPLHPLWQQGLLAVMPAVGTPGRTRSHFAEQSLLARGVELGDDEPTGWVARHLASRPGPAPVVLDGVALSATPSLALGGDERALGIVDLASAGPTIGPGALAPALEAALGQAYGAAPADLASAAAVGAEALARLRESGVLQAATQPAASYPDGVWAKRLRQVAQLLHAGIGVEAAVVELANWDTHQNIGRWDGGFLATMLERLGAALGAFVADVSGLLDRTTIVVVSEFGRRLAENHSGGTDHGLGGMALVIGNGIVGGVHGEWPGLGPDDLDRGDLATTTDVRAVLATVVARRLGNPELATVFPRWSGDLLGFA